MNFISDMEDSNNVLEIPTSPLSSSKNLSTNEISIRNHSYIISIRVDHLEQPQIEIQVEAKEGVDQWKSTFDATGKSLLFFLEYLFECLFLK